MNKYKLYLFFICILALVFAETSVPYAFAEKNSKLDKVFLGQIREPWDQNMYFSFIRQASEGHFILNNRLTYIPNKPVFVNLEFWLVGYLQRITCCSENGVYQLWRFLGALTLIGGFFLLAKPFFESTWRFILSVFLFVFSGGVGFLFIHLDTTRFNGSRIMKYGMLDLRTGGLPFQQIALNPHFSLPHGLLLLSFAGFLYARERDKLAYYIATGLILNLVGLARPYDLISVFAVIPLFLTLEFVFGNRDIKRAIRGTLPLLIVLPVFLYNIFVFKFHPIFKYWSLQGANADALPSPQWLYLIYGLAGFLAILRMFQVKAYPLSMREIFLVIWFSVTFILAESGKIVPMLGFSPQILVPALGPLAILGCLVSIPGPLRGKTYFSVLAFSLICIVIAVSNIEMIKYDITAIKNDREQKEFYADRDEVNAWAWLNNNARTDQVVLAGAITSSRISKYTGASVVLGHYSVTPRYNETFESAYKIFSDTLWDSPKRKLLSDLNVDYVYLGPEVYAAGHSNVDTTGYIKLVYKNNLTAIYKVDRTKN